MINRDVHLGKKWQIKSIFDSNLMEILAGVYEAGEGGEREFLLIGNDKIDMSHSEMKFSSNTWTHCLSLSPVSTLSFSLFHQIDTSFSYLYNFFKVFSFLTIYVLNNKSV